MVIEELFTRLGFQVDPKGIDKAKDALGSFKKWVGGLALGAGLISLAKTGVEAAMTMEGLNAQFTVITAHFYKFTYYFLLTSTFILEGLNFFTNLQ